MFRAQIDVCDVRSPHVICSRWQNMAEQKPTSLRDLVEDTIVGGEVDPSNSGPLAAVP